MATYKVLQDIEAEDKFLGPLTLRQFIYAAITVVCLYLSFIALTKHVAIFLAFLLPPAVMAGILAWPWSGQQTTEVWLLAKVRFWLKPRLRKWDQSGIKELVTVTVPKREERIYTNGLDQTEVKSRLQALAQTIDSRGWAIKNVNVNLYEPTGVTTVNESPDRLISLDNLPKEVSGLDIQAGDDIMDERSNPIAMHFEQMIQTNDKEKHEGIMERMRKIRESQTEQQPEVQEDNQWFVPSSPTTISSPTTTSTTAVSEDDEEQLLQKIHTQEQRMHAALGQPLPTTQPSTPTYQPSTTGSQTATPAILKSIGNDAPNVAVIPHDSRPDAPPPPPADEIVVSLR